MFAFSLSSHCHHVLSNFLIYIVLRLPSCWLCYDSKTCVMALFFRHTLVKKKKRMLSLRLQYLYLIFCLAIYFCMKIFSSFYQPNLLLTICEVLPVV